VQPLRPDGGGLPSGDEVREALHRVLQRPEFRKEPPGWLDDVRKAIGDTLHDAFHWVGGKLGDGMGPNTGKVLLVVLLVLLAVLLTHLIWSMLQLRVPSGSDPPPLDEEGGPVAGAGTVELPTSVAAANRLAAAGAFPEAMHALYDAALFWLDRNGHARLERFKTGADYASELGTPLRTSFRRMLAAFYPVAFGGRRAGEAEWLAMRRAASDLGLPP
jgi:hypothetical protein